MKMTPGFSPENAKNEMKKVHLRLSKKKYIMYYKVKFDSYDE